jgi:trimethylamine--corrinoid protein Co-methyltransferase
VQAVAECLAGVVYVNAIARASGGLRHMALRVGPADRRDVGRVGGTGAFVGGLRPDAQVLRHPGGAAGGMSDSKVPDMQAGWEQGIINALTGLSGLNMIYESVGMYASLMGFSPEGMVLGNDMIGQAQRCVRGIDVTEDALSLDVMKAVCLDGGPGHYLGSDQTLALMQTEYIYPEIGNRLTPKDWVEAGKPDLIEAARRRMDSILQSAPCQVPAEVDRAIRARFPIRF